MTGTGLDADAAGRAAIWGGAVLLALLISTLLEPLNRRLRKLGVPQGLCAGVSCAVLVAVLVAYADGGLGLAAGALMVVLAVQMIEGSVLQPTIQSRTVALHPAFVLLAVTAGGAVAGLLGTLLAVPLTAAAIGVVVELRRPEPGAPPA